MKKIILILAAIVLSFSCEREQPSLSLDLDELVIGQITNADHLELLGSADLPMSIRHYVQNHHAPFEIGLAFMAPGMGYEIMLENGLCLFFDMNGQHLGHNGTHDDWDNHHGWNFSGNNPCLFGDLLDPADLPQAALDYINVHYPGILSVIIWILIIREQWSFTLYKPIVASTSCGCPIASGWYLTRRGIYFSIAATD